MPRYSIGFVLAADSVDGLEPSVAEVDRAALVVGAAVPAAAALAAAVVDLAAAVPVVADGAATNFTLSTWKAVTVVLLRCPGRTDWNRVKGKSAKYS